MQLSYYRYDTSMCAVITEKVYKMFGTMNLSINNSILDNEHFTEVYSPEIAHFIVFPFDIGLFIELMGVKQTESLLATIAVYKQFEHKHVLFDYGDRTSTVKTRAIVFKVSMHFPYENNVHPLWYMTPQHVTKDTYVLDFANNKYDICFVGTNSNPLRKAACASLMHTNKLRSYIDIIDGIFDNNIFYSPQLTEEEIVTRQNTFRSCIKTSKLSFCPPGIGPHSVRFFESLYYGRIPVVVCDTKTVFPFHEVINYSQFSLKITIADVMHTGDIVYDFLSKTSKDDLHLMSIQACKIYHTYFSNKNIALYIYKTLCTHAQTSK